VKQVRRSVWLSEEFGVSGPEGVVGIGLAGLSVYTVAQDLVGGVVDQGPVLNRIA
jgi:hypothetical protein